MRRWWVRSYYRYYFKLFSSQLKSTKSPYDAVYGPTLSLLLTGLNRNQIIVGGISGDLLCLVLGDAPMKLNARQVDSAKSREKAYKQSDSAGLYLEVVPSGIQILANEVSLQWKGEVYGFWCLFGSVVCKSEGTT